LWIGFIANAQGAIRNDPNQKFKAIQKRRILFKTGKRQYLIFDIIA